MLLWTSNISWLMCPPLELSSAQLYHGVAYAHVGCKLPPAAHPPARMNSGTPSMGVADASFWCIKNASKGNLECSVEILSGALALASHQSRSASEESAYFSQCRRGPPLAG